MKMTQRICRTRAAEYREQAKTVANEWFRIELLELARVREQAADASVYRRRSGQAFPASISDALREK